MGMNFHSIFLTGDEILADISSGWGVPPGLWEGGVWWEMNEQVTGLLKALWIISNWVISVLKFVGLEGYFQSDFVVTLIGNCRQKRIWYIILLKTFHWNLVLPAIAYYDSGDKIGVCEAVFISEQLNRPCSWSSSRPSSSQDRDAVKGKEIRDAVKGKEIAKNNANTITLRSRIVGGFE